MCLIFIEKNKLISNHKKRLSTETYKIMVKEQKTTNILLLIITIPIVFYLLKVLSFIFIPLIMSMFIALMFLPLMRWLGRKNVPKPISVIIVIIVIIGALKIGAEIIQLASQEILSTKDLFLSNAKSKLLLLVEAFENFMGMPHIEGDSVFSHYIQNNELGKQIAPTLGIISSTLSMTLTTVFFTVLWLSESINFHNLMNKILLKRKHTSVKAFMKIEKDLIKFVIVKFIVSFFTGVGFSVACWGFGVSFPIFWGLFAFAINFVQMIGSFISVILLSIFAFVELDPSTTLLFFILSLAGVQVIFGSILEPVFMGKTFSINVITILIMLMLWGYIWGISGMILSIPITVFLKIIFEQFHSTKIISEVISGK